MQIFDLDAKANFGQWSRVLKISLFVWAFSLVSQALFRLLMFFLFKESVSPKDYYNYVFDAFFMGARFDFAVANYILAPWLLISFIPLLLRTKALWKVFYGLSRIYLSLMLIAISLTFLFDLTFYHYFKDHYNLMVFGLWEDDTVALVKSLWENEPVLLELLFIGLMCFGIFKYVTYFHNLKALKIRPNLFVRPLIYLASVLIIGLGARGNLNFAMHPLNRIHTEVSPYQFLNQLSFSPIYALKDALVLGFKIRRSDYDVIAQMGYKGKIEQAYADLLGVDASEISKETPHEAVMFNSGKKKGPLPHVVVIAMESWGTYWLSFDSQDYPILGKMKKHIEEDVFNLNFLPAGGGTYPSITHWLLNMAAMPGIAPSERYITKNYLTSSVKPFNEAGYETHYMYGGGLGWRNLSPFLYQLGFKDLHGETIIKKKLGGLKETHPWGVFDEDLFRYVKQHLKEATKPQFLFVLSTTNHPPFTVPSTYERPDFKYPDSLKNRMTESSKTMKQRLIAYRYAMDALGDFLNWFKQHDFDRPKVLAASGDHSFYESVQFYPENLIEWRGVPLYMYSSGGELQKESIEKKHASHPSIFPTLYDLALDNVDYIALNPSLLRKLDSFAASSWGFSYDGIHTIGNKFYLKEESGVKSLNASEFPDASRYLKKRNAYFAVAADLIYRSPEIKKTEK
jgi:phosphoglycerol transferase MdoB-like AlkP superfamily enzyme